MSVTRTLVVDDFMPFRRLVAVTVEGEAELHLIGEASDGVTAVQKAEKSA